METEIYMDEVFSLYDLPSSHSDRHGLRNWVGSP